MNHFGSKFKGGDKFNIWAFSAFFKCGIHNLEHKNVPRTLTENIRSNRFISSSNVGDKFMALALFISISIPPNSLRVSSTAAWTWFSNRISVIHGRALPPIDFISSTAEYTVPGNFGCGSLVFATTAIFAPSRAALKAIAFPIPLLAPVMKSVFPFNDGNYII